jgi:hypothetical protein
MKLARRVVKLETINRKKFRRFIVRYENPETGLLEPADLDEADYTKIFVVRVVKPVVRDVP